MDGAMGGAAVCDAACDVASARAACAVRKVHSKATTVAAAARDVANTIIVLRFMICLLTFGLFDFKMSFLLMRASFLAWDEALLTAKS
jgi:hypothetical protein